jgi:HAMP domain-containing protein
MKNTIRLKLLFFVLIPFLLIFGISSAFIINSVFQDASLPGNMVWTAVYHVIRPLAVAFIIAIAVFIGAFIYFTRIILRPIQRLTVVCEAISIGNFDEEIAQSWSDDEVGTMTRSLRRMVEQFRLYIRMQEQSGELLDIYTRLYRSLYRRNSIEGVFDEVVAVVSDFFKFARASLVLVEGEKARYRTLYESDGGLWKDADEFKYHSQVMALIAGKKYITFNAHSMAEQKIDFVDKGTLHLCILPVMAGETLKGYVIIEGNEVTGPLVNTDAALLFIAETISYMLETKDKAVPLVSSGLSPARASPPEETSRFNPVSGVPEVPAPGLPPPAGRTPHDQFRNIEGLDVDKGISLLGGAADQYGDLLRISAKVFADSIQKMHVSYQKDIPAFAIEVHGMKGALYTIGAVPLGDKAKELEFAAKAGNAAFCAEAYPPFEEGLDTLAKKLTASTKRQKTDSLGRGNTEDLLPVLKRTLEFSRNFDSAKAIGSITPLLNYSWEEEALRDAIKKIAESLEGIDYDEAERLILQLLKSLGAGDAGT